MFSVPTSVCGGRSLVHVFHVCLQYVHVTGSKNDIHEVFVCQRVRRRHEVQPEAVRGDALPRGAHGSESRVKPSFCPAAVRARSLTCHFCRSPLPSAIKFVSQLHTGGRSGRCCCACLRSMMSNGRIHLPHTNSVCFDPRVVSEVSATSCCHLTCFFLPDAGTVVV